MTKKQRHSFLVLCTLVISLVILACGSGYRITQKITGNSGEVRVRMNQADGSDQTEVEINEDYSHERVSVTVTLSVESGSCQAMLIGEDGNSLILNASLGSPIEISGELVTDAFGDITLETDAQGASNVYLLIKFVRQ